MCEVLFEFETPLPLALSESEEQAAVQAEDRQLDEVAHD
jgi:hypothetical protein